MLVIGGFRWSTRAAHSLPPVWVPERTGSVMAVTPLQQQGDHWFSSPWGPPQHPPDLSRWPNWGSWPQYPPLELACLAKKASSASLFRAPWSRGSKPVMEDEPLSPVLMALPEQERFPLSSPDAAGTSASPVPTDDFQQFQELLRRAAGDRHTPLEEV